MAGKPLRIVIAGAGFGGVYTWRFLHPFLHAARGVEVVLVNRTNHFLFSPLLHEVSTGGLLPLHIVEPLRSLFDGCSSRFVLASVKRVSFKSKVLQTTAGSLPYDYLVLALGAEPAFFKVPGAAEHALCLKTLQNAFELKNRFIGLFEQAAEQLWRGKKSGLDKLLHFVVVGGGPTGVELVCEMSEFFYRTFGKLYPPELMSHVRITLLQLQSDLMPEFPPFVRRRSLEVLKSKGIRVQLKTGAMRVGRNFVETGRGERLEAATVVWTAGVQPSPLAFDTEPARDRTGRLKVQGTLQLEGRENVFALGDIASFQDAKTGELLPALAQVATKQAEVVAKNIERKIDGISLSKFTYRSSGLLISLGRWNAAGEIRLWLVSFPLWGKFAWWLWRTVYLTKLISLRDKVRVAVDWTLNMFATRDISQF